MSPPSMFVDSGDTAASEQARHDGCVVTLMIRVIIDKIL